jgi:hypothetical protein
MSDMIGTYYFINYTKNTILSLNALINRIVLIGEKYLPEDPAYSTPDGSNFFFFLGVTSWILCATEYFFQLFRIHIHTI